jgi:molybdopterin molybdotransferase
MIKFDDAFQIVIDSARVLGTERVKLDCALNRVLAEDIIADIDLPSFNTSAMDGFACRQANLADELTVIETIPAGTIPKKPIAKNQCAKIMTGAVIPEGADCVIIKEHVKVLTENTIHFIGEMTSNNNICLKGENVKKDDIVLRSGLVIKPQHIAMLASLGCVEPLVALRPKVGIIATGTELIESHKKPENSQIRNSNGPQLAAQANSIGVITTNYGIAADTKEVLDAKVKKAIAENNVVILSGGVSVGDYDLVKEILEKNDVKLLFKRIATKPGRPVVFGVVNETSCFGLPGKPVSAFLLFELLVKPFLYKMMGFDFKPSLTRGQLKKTITRKKWTKIPGCPLY